MIASEDVPYYQKHEYDSRTSFLVFTRVDHFTTLPFRISGLFYSTSTTKEEWPFMLKYRPKKDSDQWRETILEARKSGLSDQEYCRTHGIPSSTFYSALKRLRALACEFPDKATPVYERQEVVPVNVADLSSPSADQMHQVSDVVNPMTVKAFEATIRITMGGSTLELTNDADPMVVGKRSINIERLHYLCEDAAIEEFLLGLKYSILN